MIFSLVKRVFKYLYVFIVRLVFSKYLERIHDLECELDKAYEMVNVLDGKLYRKNLKLHAEREHSSKLNKKAKMFCDMLQAQDSEVEKLKTDLKKRDLRIAQLKNAVERRDSRIKQLRYIRRSHERFVESKKSEVEELKKVLESKNALIQKLENCIQNLRRMLNEITDECARRGSELNRYRNNYEGLKEKLALILNSISNSNFQF